MFAGPRRGRGREIAWYRTKSDGGAPDTIRTCGLRLRRADARAPNPGTTHLFDRKNGVFKPPAIRGRCYCVRSLYATIRATMLAKISSAGRDFRIIGIVEWRAADKPG